MTALVVTVVGEAVMDLVESPGGASSKHPGGSPANVAVGLGRLGAAVSLLTRLGSDAYGQSLAAHLTGSGVALVHTADDDLPTSVATAHTDATGTATYDFAIVWQLPGDPEFVDLPDGTVCLHTGSIAATLEPGASTVHRLVDQARGLCTISYDPNCRPSLMGDPKQARGRIESLVGLADVVKVSDEDLAWLYPGHDYADVAQDWLALGPALVVVTRGAAGCHGVCSSGTVDLPGRAVAVADTVGAGDAFTAGLLDALGHRDLLGATAAGRLRELTTGTLSDVLREASLISAITCTRPGADPPTRDEVATWKGLPDR